MTERMGSDTAPRIDVAELDNDQLAGLARRIASVADERGMALSFVPDGADAGSGEEAYAAEAPVVTKESFAGQLPAAVKGYQAVIGVLNDNQREQETLTVAADEVIGAEFDAWFTDDKLAYITAAREADPAVNFTLVATPNVTVSPGELVRVATAFGEDSASGSNFDDGFYKQYTAEQLSGTDPGNGDAVVFSLIPDACDVGVPMSSTVPAEMRSQLSRRRAAHPFLKVPSPLEAVAYWYALRAGGDDLTDGEIPYHTHHKTGIIHFDLPERERYYMGRMRPHLPDTGLWDGGKPSLFYSRADNESVASTRLAIG
jgi:hypothetical protein